MTVYVDRSSGFGGAPGTVYLNSDGWNDYSFRTLFQMKVVDANRQLVDMGGVKVGFCGQTTDQPTVTQLPRVFELLGGDFFSLGQSEEFYRKAYRLGRDLCKSVLGGLRDVVYDADAFEVAQSEEVFGTSLMRSTSLTTIKGAYLRLLKGEVPLTDFHFAFNRLAVEGANLLSLTFQVKREALPRSNVHALIGRNGVGKTTLLNDMITAITSPDRVPAKARFTTRESGFDLPIVENYFSRLVSVSFSAFDPFSPPLDQMDPLKGTCYSYIGLKVPNQKGVLRGGPEQRFECAKHLAACFHDADKSGRWSAAIKKLASDQNFAAMPLTQLREAFDETRRRVAEQVDSEAFIGAYLGAVEGFLESMSSGHAVVLLTITQLVATVEEKTLVLIDEPESHLHPPLLSAFLRTLSELLHERNGVAIIATHSPVVLQEIPRSCVQKIVRIDGTQSATRPEIETFGENVGTLTSEVFKLEVENSGFHEVLEQAVSTGGSYEDILTRFNHQVGFEGRAILKVLLARRDKGSQG